MKIICAAIKFVLRDSWEQGIVTGINHAECIQEFMKCNLPRSVRIMEMEVSGFLTSDGTFVDRTTAYDIAEAAGQLIAERADRVLYSEFCDYSKG